MAHVLADEGADIFHGLLIRLPPAGDGYRFADRTQIAGLFERGVTLAVTADALRDPSEDPVAAGVASGDSIREGLRRAWEWLQRPV